MHDAATTTAGRPPTVPGYAVGRLLGFGGHGEVWAAHREGTGEQVALKILTVAPSERARVLRESALMRRIDHPHVVRLRDVVTLGEDGVALVLDHAPGGSLAALVATRGALDPGEVVTVLSPLATALADLHARGLVHADVTPGNVLFAGDGRPLLADLGVASLVGMDDGPDRAVTPGYADPSVLVGGTPTPASDVFGLCAVGWFALTGRAPQPSGSRPPLIPLAPGTPAELAALVERGLDVAPHRRPGAAQLAVRVFDSAPATPVRLVQTDPGAAAAEVVTHRLRVDAAAVAEPAAAAPRPRWRHPAVIAAAAAVVAVVVAGGVAVALNRDGEPSAGASSTGPSTTGEPSATEPATSAPAASAPSASASSAAPSTPVAVVPQRLLDEQASPDPAAAVPALAELRALAFANGDPAPLALANVAGSPALAADRTVLDNLAAEGLVLDGLSFDVEQVDVLSADSATATMEVTVVTGEHRRLRTADGSVVSTEPRSEPRTSRLTLQRVDDRWQVSEVG